jgi:GNAT superfamily N-acetyltransferase
MEIRSYTPATILDFVSSEQFAKFRHIPISRHRAMSYAHNPRAASTDKILFVAFENDEMAGYLGALPDRLFYRGEWKRMSWLSCFWIDPRFRGKELSKQLFDGAMKEWNGTAIITNMKPGTLKIYERTGYFHPPAETEGIRGYLRFNLAEVLPPRGGIFARLSPLLKAVDFTANLFNAIRLVFYPGYKPDPGIRYEYVEEISDGASALMDECNNRYLSRRGKAELEWINRYPWVLEQAEEDSDSRRYYFSSVSNRFFYQNVEFRDASGNVTGFLMISVRDNHLTVPYAFFRDGMEESLVKFLFNTMLDFQLNMLTVFHPRLSGEIRKRRTPFIFKKKVVRPYFLPRTMEFPELAFQDGDGDCVFT